MIDSEPSRLRRTPRMPRATRVTLKLVAVALGILLVLYLLGAYLVCAPRSGSAMPAGIQPLKMSHELPIPATAIAATRSMSP